MGSGLSSIFGESEQPSQEYLQLTDLGGFLCKYIFIMLDKDKRKLISKQEYLALVNQFREQKTTEQELDDFLKKHGGNGQSIDYIDEPLFKKLIVSLALDFDKNVVDRMKYLMGLFDKDGDGLVSEFDLCEVYETIGIQVPIEPIRCLIQKYDKDGDGKLSEQEFEQLGRSAMNKLFVNKIQSPEDILVAQALRKGSAALAAATSEDLANNNNIDESNAKYNDLCNSSGYTIVDDVVFGKPVEILESPLSLHGHAHQDGAAGGDGVSSVQAILSELTLED